MLVVGVSALATELKDDGFAPIAAGPLFDRFPLTLLPGTRTEAFGPFYYRVETPKATIVGVPPFFSIVDSPYHDARDVAILPPLLSYHRYGTQYTLMVTPLLNFFGGNYQNEVTRDRTLLFPFYFRQKSNNPDLRYVAVFPVYGTVKGIFQRTKARWIMAPIFVESWKRDVHTRNFLYPIFHLREGNGLKGWQFWPFAGAETKSLTQRTNDFGEVIPVPGHEKLFIMWPFYFREELGLGTSNRASFRGYWPAYTALKSEARNTYSAFFSLYSYTDDRVQKYRQWGFPWPIWVKARGEGKHITRIIPFYNYGSNNLIVSRSYMWPAYIKRTLDTGPALVTRTRVMLYLWSEVKEEVKATGEIRRRQNSWPLFTRQEDAEGSYRLQVFAPLEPMLPAGEVVERVFSPLWSVWRSQYNATNHAASESFLWNLYRHDRTPDLTRWSLLWGLFQGRQTKDQETLRVFFIPITQRRDPALAGRCSLPANQGNAAAVWLSSGAASRGTATLALPATPAVSDPLAMRGATCLMTKRIPRPLSNSPEIARVCGDPGAAIRK